MGRQKAPENPAQIEGAAGFVNRLGADSAGTGRAARDPDPSLVGIGSLTGNRCGSATNPPSCRSLAEDSGKQWARIDMLRTLLLVIVLLIVIVIALVSFGIINLYQGSDGTVSIRTSDVEVGTTTTNVQVPVVRMENRVVEVPAVGVENEAPPANGQ
jgi:hypothetical protein